MPKHILDRSAPRTDGKLVVTFAETARNTGEGGPSSATLELQRRAQDRPTDNPRVREYTRIEAQTR